MLDAPASSGDTQLHVQQMVAGFEQWRTGDDRCDHGAGGQQDTGSGLPVQKLLERRTDTGGEAAVISA